MIMKQQAPDIKRILSWQKNRTRQCS